MSKMGIGMGIGRVGSYFDVNPYTTGTQDRWCKEENGGKAWRKPYIIDSMTALCCGDFYTHVYDVAVSLTSPFFVQCITVNSLFWIFRLAWTRPKLMRRSSQPDFDRSFPDIQSGFQLQLHLRPYIYISRLRNSIVYPSFYLPLASNNAIVMLFGKAFCHPFYFKQSL